MTKVFIYSVYGDWDEDSEITVVFDSIEKAEKWDERMHELLKLHQKYHEDGTVAKCGKGTSRCPEVISLMKEARTFHDGYSSGGYIGKIVAMEVE